MAEKGMPMHFVSSRTRLSRAVAATCGVSALLLAASATAGPGAAAAGPDGPGVTPPVGARSSR